jgi:hypothetical protein
MVVDCYWKLVVDLLMMQLISQQGFGKVGVIAHIKGQLYQQAELTAWVGMLVEQGNERTWIDILVEVDSSAMGMIFEQTMGRLPESDEERKAFLASTHMIVSSAFKTAFQNTGATVTAKPQQRGATATAGGTATTGAAAAASRGRCARCVRHPAGSGHLRGKGGFVGRSGC